jgi:hypothetical protein
MKELIGVTFHFKDGSVQKVPVSALMGGGGSKASKRFNWIDEPECPQHGRWEWVPPGTRKDGSAYKGFWTCTDDDCLNRPGREWADGIDPDAYMAEGANDDSAEDMDGLPF